ncbi:Hypothetical protein CAP_4072 [Chondromyces apiculatus DSM 436]|uniref:Uncharacterized protein n=1 Tax=Chondromyces apiculatus DSM 436 TaxID=1192034 RepID=A0A017TI64_9BACT|nr:Hypothetical protein CAP_4072 [Chondromyces apiculatus DSM 436]
MRRGLRESAGAHDRAGVLGDSGVLGFGVRTNRRLATSNAHPCDALPIPVPAGDPRA